jgi:putative nucleotidyltransferase with HDIG domain
VTLALAVAIFAARKVSQPIQKLADSTHQIAAGNFSKRLPRIGPGKEIGDLAEDFNRMSGHVESYVDRLQDAAQENRELFIGSMRSFVAAIDAKDPYTRGHSERVATYSRIISKSLGLSETEQHKIWVGALLHDVGKIGIEDRILTKGGVLSEEEYDQMKLHPVIGAQIMSRIEQLKEMIPAIRWHHEAWNGSGYPDGLKGEQIPLSARITGVADSFDAITTNRPYQRAYEPDFAVETITRLAGTRFDAKVVTAFLQAFESGQIQKRTTPPPTAEELRAVASS